MSLPPEDGPADDDLVGWVGLDRARDLWPDADTLDDDVLTTYLLAAHKACAEFAPALEDDANVPEAWAVAQVMQARAVYRSRKAGGRDQLGPDGFAVTVFPLDWNVRQLLRPKKGRPSFA